MTRSIKFAVLSGSFNPGRLWPRVFSLVLVMLLLLAPLHSAGAAPVASHQASRLFADATWTLDTPQGWASKPTTIAVTVQDADGLQVATAAYRYSTNGGSTWSSWASDAALQISSTVSTTVRMTATLGSLINSATANRVQFRVTDLVAVENTSPSYTIRVDSLAPASPLNPKAEPGTWTTINSFDVRWTNPAQSASPIQRAYYKRGSAPTSNADYDGYHESLNVAQITAIAATSKGGCPCYIWLQDEAGNTDYTTAVSVMLYLASDSDPEPPTNMQIAPSSWTSSNQFTATWTNPFVDSGVEAAWYKWGAPPTSNDDYDGRVAGKNISTLTGLAAPEEGSNNLHVWLEDGLGRRNYTRRATAPAHYDITPPVTSHSFTPPLPAGGWFSNTVTVNLLAVDAFSGVKVTKWQPEGGTIWNEGTSITANSHVTYSIKSEDNVGNVEVAHPITVPIDKLPPTSSISLAVPVPPSGWFTGTVNVNITAQDDLSGWGGVSYYRLHGGAWQRGTQVAISGNGSHNLQYYSRDIAGNTESAKTQLNVCQIDQDPPTVTATVSKIGLYVQPPVTITLEAEDSGSGVAKIEYRREGTSSWSQGDSILIDGSQGDGVYAYAYRAHDVAGNVSAVGTVAVNVDGTPPAKPTNLSAVPVGWTKVDGEFELHWTNPVDLAGIAGVYYQLDVDPALEVTATDPVLLENIQSLTELTAGSEGAHDVYIWLVDKVGNHDPATRQVLTGAFKYDTTAPAPVLHRIEGPMGDDGKHYTDTVTVTLVATDTHSGLSEFCYQVVGQSVVTKTVSGGPNTAQCSFNLLDTDSRMELFYWAIDVAGNKTSKIGPVPLYFDPQAPDSPGKLRVTPEGWSNTNSFTLDWNNPWDYAGISAAYYKMGAAPTANDDGQLRTLSPGQATLSGLTVEDEGETPVFLWLQDRAGNIDYTTAISVPLRYDITPPVTTLTFTGTTRNTYYITPVTIHLAAKDITSGVMHTAYRIDRDGVEGTWQTWEGDDIVLDQDGSHTVHYYSVDMAQNIEITQQKTFKVDLHAPVVNLSSLSGYTGSTTTYVSWVGNDGPHGSGIARYTVQVRRGGCSTWQPWLTNIAADRTGETFGGMWSNHFYYFRIRAEDKAGHVSDWSPINERDGNYIYVEGLTNPRFDGSMNGWTVDPGGQLPTALVYARSRTGNNSHMVRLGEELYDPEHNMVAPDSYASIYQTIQLPPADCDHGLIVSFWANMSSWDVAWSVNIEKWFDTLDVRVSQADGSRASVALRYGHFYPPGTTKPYTLWQSGWVRLTADLTPWAGQRVRLDFRLNNGVDGFLPSWAFIDDIQLLPSPGRMLYLPIVTTPTGGAKPRAILSGQSATPSQDDNSQTGHSIPAR